MEYYYKFASANYNDSAYGSDVYGGRVTSETSSATQPAQPGGQLAETGYDVLVPLALGVALVGASLVVLIKKLRRRN